MRLADWPRMPFLSEELRGWVNEHLATLGVDEIAVFATEAATDDDGRRVLVATDIGMIDYRYGPQASTARFAITGRIIPWQAVRGVDLRVETVRLWALEHRTRWGLTMIRPRFRAGTDDPALGRALADFAKVAVVMAEPSGWPPPSDEPMADGQVSPGAQVSTPQARSAAQQAPARQSPQPQGVLRQVSPAAPVGPGVTRPASHPQS
jgi:hypothetical protein